MTPYSNRCRQFLGQSFHDRVLRNGKYHVWACHVFRRYDYHHEDFELACKRMWQWLTSWNHDARQCDLLDKYQR